MAMQVAQSGLAKKYGGRLDAAVKSHANDDTEYGFQQLPAGINGIARLVKCYFDQYKTGDNKGEYYLRCEGGVVSPVMHRLPDGSEIKVVGMTTSIMRPMCETKTKDGKITPQDANVADAMNELRKLGGDTSAIQSGADLETLAEALQSTHQSDHPIYFHFRTTVRNPRPGTNDSPGVWENWLGCKGLENFQPPDASAGMVQDNGVATTAPAVTESKVAESTGAVAANGSHSPASLTQPGNYTDQGDIDSLVERAEANDVEAQNELKQMAEAAGVGDEFAAAPDWAAGGEVLKGTQSVAAQNENEPEANPIPAVGNMYKYKPVVKGPGGKEVQSKKAVDVEVVKVNTKNNTVDLKNTVDGKTMYKGVGFDSLE